MKSIPNWLCTLALCAAAMCVSYQLPARRADAQQRFSGVRWQYGILTLSSEKPIFVESSARSTANPYNTASMNRESDSTFGSVSVNRTEAVNLDVSFMDAMGEQGWEAYSTSVGNGKIVVFMRRPA